MSKSTPTFSSLDLQEAVTALVGKYCPFVFRVLVVLVFLQALVIVLMFALLFSMQANIARMARDHEELTDNVISFLRSQSVCSKSSTIRSSPIESSDLVTTPSVPPSPPPPRLPPKTLFRNIVAQGRWVQEPLQDNVMNYLSQHLGGNVGEVGICYDCGPRGSTHEFQIMEFLNQTKKTAAIVFVTSCGLRSQCSPNFISADALQGATMFNQTDAYKDAVANIICNRATVPMSCDQEGNLDELQRLKAMIESINRKSLT